MCYANVLCAWKYIFVHFLFMYVYLVQTEDFLHVIVINYYFYFNMYIFLLKYSK